MHELPITESIVKIASEELEKYKGKKVLEVKLMVGERTGLIPECIQTYFDIVSQNTKVEGAKISITNIPVTFSCSLCNTKFHINESEGNCPNCHSGKVKLIGGNEFYIDSMVIDE